MLLSMTGYGAGHVDENGVSVAVEIRTVNNRYLKLHCRLPDGYAAAEPRIEAMVRNHLRRGAIQLNVDLRKAPSVEDYTINTDLIRGYYQQLQQLQNELINSETVRLELLLSLPGVINDPYQSSSAVEDDWPLIESAVKQALTGLRDMCEAEGAAMARDLAEQCKEIERCANDISRRAPQVVEAYQQRLTERINKLLDQHDVQAQPADIVKEIGMFAERADMSEELVRLRSHLEQFGEVMDQEDGGGGRKLEFVVQELLRETNTVGSKANDAEIAKQVVHVKTCLERMREMVQNVE